MDDFMTTTMTPIKQALQKLFVRIKKLHGNPGYIAMGMAVGVFVSFTPTIPFHTIIAIALAFLLKGSKPAAAIGVWLANPLTIPFFYYISFKMGTLLIARPIPFDIKFESIKGLISLGVDVTAAMVLGGAILGILPSIAVYVLTYHFMSVVRRKATKQRG